ncbi:hypothetical protein Bca52824_007779 [Brassica carinata]|uniref:Uncharacterized protein n=1 Tax=Brassica carinata TaxID=52824 RepID=A0A8X7W840_BRACI|nr:hypothetical protein Bca52824_007779 [Brassica carinata]
MIYTGPLGQNSCHIIEYFENVPGVPKIRDNHNPATWMLDVSSQSAEVELSVDFAKIYNESALFKSNSELVKQLSQPDSGSNDLQFKRTYAQSCRVCDHNISNDRFLSFGLQSLLGTLLYVHFTSISMFRCLAAIFQTIVASVTAGSFGILITFVFAGFVIPPPSMRWLKWGFWANPLSYSEIGLSVNEFLAPRWSQENHTESRGLNYDGYMYWVSLCALVGFTVLFNTIFTLALTFLKSPTSSRAMISQEKLSELQGTEDTSDSSSIKKRPQIPLAIKVEEVLRCILKNRNTNEECASWESQAQTVLKSLRLMKQKNSGGGYRGKECAYGRRNLKNKYMKTVKRSMAGSTTGVNCGGPTRP